MSACIASVVFSKHVKFAINQALHVTNLLTTSNNFDGLINQFQKHNTMGNLLYIIAVILIIGWAVGFIGFHAGGLIHVLLVIAVVAVLLRVISGSRLT